MNAGEEVAAGRPSSASSEPAAVAPSAGEAAPRPELTSLPAPGRLPEAAQLAAPLAAPAGLLYLVRHANAGNRSAWTEDDELRPLSQSGRRQAEGIVHLYRGLGVSRIVSSPYLRCAQTLRPLALDRGVEIEFSPALAEGAMLADALALVEASPSDSVLCSHGDVIAAVVAALRVDDMRVDGKDGWKKGSTWVLERAFGRVVAARYVQPPRHD